MAMEEAVAEEMDHQEEVTEEAMAQEETVGLQEAADHLKATAVSRYDPVCHPRSSTATRSQAI